MKGAAQLLLFIFAFLNTPHAALGEETPRLCAALLSVAKILHQRDSTLHTRHPVLQAQRHLRSLGLPISQRPAERIAEWLLILEQTHSHAQSRRSVLQRLRAYYHREHVITAGEIPEGYFNLQRRIAREQGRGDIEITPSLRRQYARVLIADQKTSLNEWLNYFLSAETDDLPFALKYWAFTEVVKMAPFDPATGTFPRRNSETVGLFPELNREALRIAIAERQNSQGNESFSQLYGAAIARARALAFEAANLNGETEGRWVYYPQGSKPKALVQSLRNRCTGWCTAEPATAKEQLKNGAFHVYYSLDRDGQATIPRIAIRMEGSHIAEVRGIAKHQNIDSDIAATPILEQKLAAFGAEGEKYLRASSDMARMSLLEKKSLSGEILTTEDLRFLYEIDSKIEIFGYGDDPRIAEIINRRDKRQDLAFLFNVPPERISFTTEDALSGNIALHYGDLDLTELRTGNGVVLPQIVVGDLLLSSLTSAVGLTFSHTVTGDINLSSLRSAEGLVLPEIMNGGLDLFSLLYAHHLVLPKTMNGSIDLNGLVSATRLVLPQTMNGTLELMSLRSARGLILPQKMNGNIFLNELTSANGLVLPQSMNGNLSLHALKSARGLLFPPSFNGNIYLGLLRSAKGLILPQSLLGHLDLRSLTSARGLVLPQTLTGNLDLSSLTSTSGMTFPISIEGNLVLTSLRRARGLILPQSIGISLDLLSLNTLDGITFPHSIGRAIYFTRILISRKEMKSRLPHLYEKLKYL